MLKDNHIGKFTIPLEIINNYPEKVKEFMSDMIVIEAKMDFMARGVTYIAINPNVFLEAAQNLEAPWYEIEIYGYKDKSPDMSIKKMNGYSY